MRSGSPKTILTTQRYFGTANWNQYGIPASSRNVVRNAFNEATQNIPQESSRQNNSRGSSRTYNDELCDSLLRAGAAITEQDAAGAVDYSENANEADFSREEGFSFSENSEVKSYERQERVIQANRHTVANMESVCNLAGNEFPKNGEPIIDRVDAFFAKHGNSAYNEELGDIDMVHSSIHDDLSHGKGHVKITAFAAIPDVLKHGRVVEYSDNWKDRGYDTALVAAPITIGGEPYFAGCRVMRKVNDNSQRYYIHEAIFYGEKEPSETFTTRFSAKGGATRASDSSSIKIVLSEIAGIKRDAESSQFNFSENAPTKRQSRLNKAWELFDNNSTPAAYYESNPRGFDVKTNNLLRGLMLRNGEDVGGALSDATMERIAGIFEGATRRNALSLSLSSPVRVFEDVTGWGGRTAEERAKNVRNGNLLKNTYYEYGNLQAANRETWIAENMRPVIEATTKQNPVNSCPDGRGGHRGCSAYPPATRRAFPATMSALQVTRPARRTWRNMRFLREPGRCLNVWGPYRKPCRTCSAAS